LAAEAVTQMQHYLWDRKTAWRVIVSAKVQVCLFMHGSKLPNPAEFAVAVVDGAGMRRVLLAFELWLAGLGAATG